MKTTQYKFKQQSPTGAERLWLSEVASSPSFSSRHAKVKLRDKLPRDFSPDEIDPRLYVNGKLTPLGVWHVDPKSGLLQAIDKAISTVRARIEQNPAITSIKSDEVAHETGLAEKAVSDAFEAANTLDNFVTSSSGTSAIACSEIQFVGDRAFDAYLRYDGIESLLEKFYIDRGRALEQSAVALGQIHSRSPEIPEFPVHERRVRQNTAFVLMAIDRNSPDLEDVYEAIKDICREFGINAYRADEIEHQESITERVIAEIKTSEYLIADLTLERPNVYYEIGHAHALDLHPILYRKSGTKLHFDLAGHNVPEYKNTTELRKILRKRLEAMTGRSPPANLVQET